MDDYTALSDDSFEDFIVSGNCREKQNSKDIEQARRWGVATGAIAPALRTS